MNWQISDSMDAQSADERDRKLSLNGDGDAYARLVRRHQSAVAARMWRFSRDKADHQELVHEVFVQTFLSLPTYRGKAPFEHWVARIATTVGYKYWKRKAVERSNPTVSDERLENLACVKHEALGPEGAAEMLHAFMERLPPRDRLVLSLRYIEGNSVEETATLTGWSQAMVKVQAWRARGKLKKLFQEAGVEVES